MTQDKMRERFEEWAKPRNFNLSRQAAWFLSEDTSYEDLETDAAWQAWNEREKEVQRLQEALRHAHMLAAGGVKTILEQALNQKPE